MPGETLWAVASGKIKPWLRKSREAVDYIAGLPGYVAVHIVPEDGRTLWFFETLNDAKGARNLMRSKGIAVGANISKWDVAADGIPDLDEEWR